MEFAFVVPILLVLVLGIVDFGVQIGRMQIANNAAREGVRMAAQGASEAEVRAAVDANLGSRLGGDVEITVACKKPSGSACSSFDGGAETGGLAIVTVKVTSDWLTPIGRMATPQAVTGREATMRIE